MPLLSLYTKVSTDHYNICKHITSLICSTIGGSLAHPWTPPLPLRVGYNEIHNTKCGTLKTYVSNNA